MAETRANRELTYTSPHLGRTPPASPAPDAVLSHQCLLHHPDSPWGSSPGPITFSPLSPHFPASLSSRGPQSLSAPCNGWSILQSMSPHLPPRTQILPQLRSSGGAGTPMTMGSCFPQSFRSKYSLLNFHVT